MTPAVSGSELQSALNNPPTTLLTCSGSFALSAACIAALAGTSDFVVANSGSSDFIDNLSIPALEASLDATANYIAIQGDGIVILTDEDELTNAFSIS